MMKITAMIANYRTSKFVDILLKSLDKLTVNDIRVLICDNTPTPDEFEKLSTIAMDYAYVDILTSKNTQFGSLNHGLAMNKMLGSCKTQYASMIDSDVVILKHGWDETLFQELNEKTRAVGWGPNLITLSLFDARLAKNLKVDLRPGADPTINDTSWQLPFKLFQNDYNVISLSHSNRPKKTDPFFGIASASLYFNQTLMATHFGRGSTMGAAKYFKRLKIPGLKHVMRKYQGIREFNQWKNKAMNIVNMENKEVVIRNKQKRRLASVQHQSFLRSY